MINKTELSARDNGLTEKGTAFLSIKNDLTHDCDLSHKSIQLNNKKRMMELFKASEADWNDWIWQMQHRIISVEQLALALPLCKEQLDVTEKVSKKYRFAVSPYYLSLINPNDLNDVIAKMVLPSEKELLEFGVSDPSDEMNSNPVGAVVRRYPDRVIINVTNSCSSYCRHCQRRRLIGDIDSKTSKAKIFESIDYIAKHTEIRDVLITGGDALSLSDKEIEFLLSQLRSINHIEIIRIGTRMPVNLPQRITKELVATLKKYSPIYLNTQFNHPNEITAESVNCLNMLADNGIVLGNQMVLLNGVNNDKYVVRYLNQLLLSNRVRPYYIFQAKNVQGTEHFKTSINEGLEIINYLQGNTSGLAIPTYIYSVPKGKGKVPLCPQYVKRTDGDKFIVKTWENLEITINEYGEEIQ